MNNLMSFAIEMVKNIHPGFLSGVLGEFICTKVIGIMNFQNFIGLHVLSVINSKDCLY